MGRKKAPRPAPIEIPQPPPPPEPPPKPRYQQSEDEARRLATELFGIHSVDMARAGVGELDILTRGLFTGELSETAASLRVSDIGRRFRLEDETAAANAAREAAQKKADEERVKATEEAKKKLETEAKVEDTAVQKVMAETVRRRSRGRGGFAGTILAKMMQPSEVTSLMSTLGR